MGMSTPNRSTVRATVRSESNGERRKISVPYTDPRTLAGKEVAAEKATAAKAAAAEKAARS